MKQRSSNKQTKQIGISLRQFVSEKESLMVFSKDGACKETNYV